MTTPDLHHKSILLIGSYLSGGQRGVSQDLADRLHNNGWEIWLTSRINNRLLRLVDMVYTIVKERKKYRIAHVDVYSGYAFIWAEICCAVLRLLRKPYSICLRGGNMPGFSGKNPGRVRSLLESAKVVTAPSRYLFDTMQAYRSDMILIPNPIDLSNYAFCLRKIAAPNLIWLRAFHNVYQPQLALRVIGLLKKSYPEIHLTMVGPDKGDGSFQETQKICTELGVSGNVELLGGIEKQQVPDLLNRGDIFINTTNVDNTPVSVMEAMACGLCVVSTNVGGIPYLLENEKDALLVSPNDPEAMASAVSRIIGNPALTAQLSYNARKKVEFFDWQVVYPQLLVMFEQMVDDGQKSQVKNG